MGAMRRGFAGLHPGTRVALPLAMPITRPPHTALLPWLAALTGSVAIQLVTPLFPARQSPAPHVAVPSALVVPCRPDWPPAKDTEAPKIRVSVEHAVGTYEYIIDREDIDDLGAEQIRQHVVSSAEGFRLAGVRRGSLFHELGFMNGDLVVSIEGGDATRFHVLRGRERHSIDIVMRIA